MNIAQAVSLCAMLTLTALVARADAPAERRLSIATNVLGLATLKPTLDLDDASSDVRPQATAATAGLLVGDTWRFWDRMVLAPVLGAKVTGSDPDDQSPLAPGYVESRLNAGVTF
jgi:hypothetical protein